MSDATFETANRVWQVTVTKSGERHMAAVAGTTLKVAELSPPAAAGRTPAHEDFEIRGGRDHLRLMGDVRAEIERRDGKIK